MNPTTGNGDFLTFQRQILDKSPQDVRSYWTSERKRKAVPTFRTDMGSNVADTLDAARPDGANAAPTTDPKQADLSQMPFITGGKLFFTLDGVDYVASGNIFMKNNLLLTAAHCVQDGCAEGTMVHRKRQQVGLRDCDSEPGLHGRKAAAIPD